jgi:hypothetical protein
MGGVGFDCSLILFSLSFSDDYVINEKKKKKIDLSKLSAR